MTLVSEQQALAPSNVLSFAPLTTLLANVPTEPPWLWDGYLAPGWVTLIAGQPKVGKSTLVHGLLGALANGLPFLGSPTRATSAALLSEEPVEGLSEKTARFGGAENLHALADRMQLRSVPWPELVEGAVAYALSNGLGLLVVDTLAELAGIRGEEENDSGAMLEAVAPLKAAADAGLAVLIVAHQRKSRGRHGSAVRGSNALTGAVDIILELERAWTPNARTLYGTSRHPKTPERLRLQLVDEGYTAQAPQSAREQFDEDYDLILSVLDGLGAVSVKELSESTGVARKTLIRRLSDLEQRSAVEIVAGTGKRGDPALWSLTAG